MREVMAVLLTACLAPAAVAANDDHEVVFRFTDPAIIESSGLSVLPDGRFVTVNDSGDESRVFTVDPESGDTVAVRTWLAYPVDIEGLAPARDGGVWVADIGDNRESRESVSITKLTARPDDGPVDATAKTYNLTYPDGPHNAETVLANPSRKQVLVVTKETGGGTVYAAPRRLNPLADNLLRPLGSVLPMATDGAFFPDGRHIIMRNYSRANVYTFPDLTWVGGFGLPKQEQGEGIAVAADGQIYLSSEGVRSAVLRVSLPKRLAALMAEGETTSPTDLPSVSATPSSSGDPRDAGDSADPGESGDPGQSGEAEEPGEAGEWWSSRWAWLGVAGVLAAGVVGAVATRGSRRR